MSDNDHGHDSDETPNPGSLDAVSAGCLCPVVDNSYGRGYMGEPGEYIYSTECPLHRDVFGDGVSYIVRSEDDS